ncbi:sulfurtransferase complex subunit TusB [Candidatus Erwinia haradaeae]|nr:sulfurtransferase complex subunit TusB [Candidatus Erwinia haradaeae]
MITHSPFQCDFRAILRLISPGDDVLLLGDGVIMGIESGITFPALCNSTQHVYILKVDLIARGLLIYISPQATVITYNEFINLTIEHPQQISW